MIKIAREMKLKIPPFLVRLLEGVILAVAAGPLGIKDD